MTPRRDAGIAYDPARQRIMTFGGVETAGPVHASPLRETWEWDGRTWTRHDALFAEPAAVELAATAYDTAHERVLLVGAASSPTPRLDLVAWRGGAWSSVVTAQQPPYRTHYAVAFDEVRQRLVLWGGSDATGALLDVWEFDGANWTAIPALGPSGRNEPALAFDGTRILMFGGRALNGGRALADTWQWDGTRWTQLAPLAAPAARFGHSMTFDPARRRVLLFGGGNDQPRWFDDTWEWNGTAWTQVAATSPPPPRSGHGATWDTVRGGLVVAFGQSDTALLADIWTLVGSSWRKLSADTPEGRYGATACHDSVRDEIVLFGGSIDGLTSSTLASDTWLYARSEWRRAMPTNSPSVRRQHAMACDAARGRVVLFGGFTYSGDLGDTWLFDGTNWTQASPTTAPPARFGAAMAFDSRRGRVVLFGGITGSGLLSDTWEWDGANWLVGPSGPTARYGHAMVYVANRGYTVLFGGDDGAAKRDTWTYDGTVWVNRGLASMVPGRSAHAMVYDPFHGATFLFGGTVGTNTYTSSTAWWDGSDWRPLPIATPPARGGHVLAWDGTARRVMMFGGRDAEGGRADAWALTTNVAAAVEPLAPSVGCGGGSGPAALRAFGRPVVGNRSFALTLSTTLPQPGTPVVVLMSRASSTVRLGACSIDVDPASVFTALFATHDHQVTFLPLEVPRVVSLYGVEAYAQAAYWDPPSPLGGLAISTAARIRLGDD